MNKTRLALYLSVGFLLTGGCMAGDPENEVFNKHEREAVQKLLNKYEIRISEPEEKLVPEAEWPRHVAPIVLEERWKTPSEVWRIHGGHLIAYEAGEWGGAIFFLPLNERDLLLVAKGIVNSIAKVSRGTYIAAGGSRSRGSVKRLWIGPELKWHSKDVLTTSAGMPTVLGTRDDAAVIAIIEHTTKFEGPQKRDVPFIVTENKSLFGLYTVGADGDIEVLDSPRKK